MKRTRVDGFGRPKNRHGHHIHISAVGPEHWGDRVTWEDAPGNDHPGYLYRASAEVPVDNSVRGGPTTTVYEYRYHGTNWHRDFWDAFMRWFVHHSWMPH